MVLQPFLGRLVGVSLPLVASPRKKRICNLLCSDRHNPDVTQRKYPIAPRKCSQIVVLKMLCGTDTPPNMAPARYKQPVARQLLHSSWINRLIRDPRGDCRWNKRRMDQKRDLTRVKGELCNFFGLIYLNITG